MYLIREGGRGGSGGGGNPGFVFLPVSRADQPLRGEQQLTTQSMPVNLTMTDRAVRYWQTRGWRRNERGGGRGKGKEREGSKGIELS